jgi:hypothetical protein
MYTGTVTITITDTDRERLIERLAMISGIAPMALDKLRRENNLHIGVTGSPTQTHVKDVTITEEAPEECDEPEAETRPTAHCPDCGNRYCYPALDGCPRPSRHRPPALKPADGIERRLARIERWLGIEEVE